MSSKPGTASSQHPWVSRALRAAALRAERDSRIELGCHPGDGLQQQHAVAASLDREHQRGDRAEPGGGRSDDRAAVVELRQRARGALVHGERSKASLRVTDRCPLRAQGRGALQSMGGGDRVDRGARQLLAPVVGVHAGGAEPVVIGGGDHEALVEQAAPLRAVVVVEEVAGGARGAPVGDPGGAVGPGHHRSAPLGRCAGRYEDHAADHSRSAAGVGGPVEDSPARRPGERAGELDHLRAEHRAGLGGADLGGVEGGDVVERRVGGRFGARAVGKRGGGERHVGGVPVTGVLGR